MIDNSAQNWLMDCVWGVCVIITGLGCSSSLLMLRTSTTHLFSHQFISHTNDSEAEHVSPIPSSHALHTQPTHLRCILTKIGSYYLRNSEAEYVKPITCGYHVNPILPVHSIPSLHIYIAFTQRSVHTAYRNIALHKDNHH